MAAYYDKVVTVNINKYVPAPERKKPEAEDTFEEASQERFEGEDEETDEEIKEREEEKNTKLF